MGSNENQVIASGLVLTPEEITFHRGGCPREPLRPYTLHGNSVKLLVNGDQVFNELYKDLLAVESGDFIWMTGWDIDSTVMLYPNPKKPDQADKSHIDKLLLAAIGRGVEIRMLLNSPNLLDPLKPMLFCEPLNDAAGKTVCAPDQRHNSVRGSLHQRSWVIQRDNETVAYVGSMDMAAGRYDTRAHDQNSWWKFEPPFPQNFYGFTGGMLQIKGQAVIDVARHLYDQITDPADPFYDYTMAPVTWPDPHSPIGKYDGVAQIQVVLTAGPRGSRVWLLSELGSQGRAYLACRDVEGHFPRQEVYRLFLDMSVGVYDPVTVKEIRKQLWSEHLNLNPDSPSLDDPQYAIHNVWPDIADPKKLGRIRRYWPEDCDYWSYYKHIFEIFEPCGLVDQDKCQKIDGDVKLANAVRGPSQSYSR
jgi:hypothetical protein